MPSRHDVFWFVDAALAPRCVRFERARRFTYERLTLTLHIARVAPRAAYGTHGSVGTPAMSRTVLCRHRIRLPVSLQVRLYLLTAATVLLHHLPFNPSPSLLTILTYLSTGRAYGTDNCKRCRTCLPLPSIPSLVRVTALRVTVAHLVLCAPRAFTLVCWFNAYRLHVLRHASAYAVQFSSRATRWDDASVGACATSHVPDHLQQRAATCLPRTLLPVLVRIPARLPAYLPLAVRTLHTFTYRRAAAFTAAVVLPCRAAHYKVPSRVHAHRLPYCLRFVVWFLRYRHLQFPLTAAARTRDFLRCAYCGRQRRGRAFCAAEMLRCGTPSSTYQPPYTARYFGSRTRTRSSSGSASSP